MLSGGGIRGLAHVGVIKALSEEEIRPDVVSGTSAGAIVGALFGAGYSSEEMLEFFVEKSPFRLSKLALGKPGFFDTAKIYDDFREYFPEDSFEALSLPLFVTATDLVEARRVVFSKGPLIRPVLASSSVPFVFTPTEIDGRLYADGGILDNFPVDPVTDLCDLRIGAYASPLRDVDRKSLGSTLSVSQRSFEIGMHSASRQRFGLCDLVISPPELARFTPFETKAMRECLEIGYRAARARMPEIRELLDRPG